MSVVSPSVTPRIPKYPCVVDLERHIVVITLFLVGFYRLANWHCSGQWIKNLQTGTVVVSGLKKGRETPFWGVSRGIKTILNQRFHRR
jgi:hypothetical protein